MINKKPLGMTIFGFYLILLGLPLLSVIINPSLGSTITQKAAVNIFTKSYDSLQTFISSFEKSENSNDTTKIKQVNNQILEFKKQLLIFKKTTINTIPITFITTNIFVFLSGVYFLFAGAGVFLSAKWTRSKLLIASLFFITTNILQFINLLNINQAAQQLLVESTKLDKFLYGYHTLPSNILYTFAIKGEPNLIQTTITIFILYLIVPVCLINIPNINSRLTESEKQ